MRTNRAKAENGHYFSVLTLFYEVNCSKAKGTQKLTIANQFHLLLFFGMEPPICTMARRFPVSLSTASTCQEHGADTRRQASTRSGEDSRRRPAARRQDPLSASFGEAPPQRYKAVSRGLLCAVAQSDAAQHRAARLDQGLKPSFNTAVICP